MGEPKQSAVRRGRRTMDSAVDKMMEKIAARKKVLMRGK